MRRTFARFAIAVALGFLGMLPASAEDRSPRQDRFIVALAEPSGTIDTRSFRQHLLHAAALNNMTEWAVRLIQRGMEVDTRDPNRRTPLMVAAAFNSIDVARALVDRGADPRAADAVSRAQPIHFAAAGGHVDMIDLLRSHGADLNARADVGRTPLHYAAYYGRRKAIAYLIAEGVDPDVSDDMGIRPLQNATRQLQSLAIDQLLRLGARPDNLFDAINAGDVARVQTLLAHGADVNALDLFGTPLHRAAATGQVFITNMLIDAGADLEAEGEPGGARPLHVAALNRQPAIARLLLDRGALVDSRDAADRTPLIFAAVHDGVGVARELLAAGADPLAQNQTGLAPIHAAVHAGHIEMVELLLARGVDVNQRSGHDGMAPISYAAEMGLVAMLRYLVSRGADPNLRDDTGRTPVQLALSRTKTTSYDAAQELRRLGAR